MGPEAMLNTLSQFDLKQIANSLLLYTQSLVGATPRSGHQWAVLPSDPGQPGGLY